MTPTINLIERYRVLISLSRPIRSHFHYKCSDCRPSVCNFHKCSIENLDSHRNESSLDIITCHNFGLLVGIYVLMTWNPY